MSRIVSGKLAIATRPTLVQPPVDAAVNAHRPAAEAKHIVLDLDLDPTLGPIEADPDRFHQMVWNLISNAIKFTPADGRVTVRLRTDDAQVCLSVQDTGIGFEPGVAAHLFERFRQGDSSPTRQYGGLALGLGIVRHLAELHGGTVAASSGGADRGSLFEVRLPLRRADHYVADGPRTVEAGPSLRGVSVMVVDDDPQALSFARASLEQYGANVVAVRSARKARERFARGAPDVLVSDLLMPEQDGLDLIKAIRALDAEHGGRTPAAALTALARSSDRRRTFDAGYQLHVTKPIDPYELASAVDQLAHTH